MDAVDFSMSGKVALLTGAGRGIGRAIGLAFAAAGAAVAIQDIDESVAAELAEQIRRAGGRAAALGGDVADLSLPERVIAQTVSTLGGLHVLVNNASVQHNQNWLDLSAEDVERELRADLVSPILFTQHAVRVFRTQRYGRIVNLGSTQQRRGNPWMLPYSLSKSALATMTTALACELAADGITVNLIAPGWFNTYRNRGNFKGPDDLKEKGKQIPVGRIGEPRDCAGAALLLCSEAGAYITGQTLFIDGGFSIR